MTKRAKLLLLGLLTCTGCSGARLSQDEARRKIAELGRSTLVPDAVEIQRIVSQTDNEVIAESTVTLAFQFKKDPKGEWNVSAVRLGDRDWINLNEMLAAIDESRRRQTSQAMQKVVTAIDEYRKAKGTLPPGTNIVELTDILHPQFMIDLVRTDSWGNPIEYVRAGLTYKLVSRGSDGISGTADDIVLQGATTSANSNGS